jgi:hypothetical protein
MKGMKRSVIVLAAVAALGAVDVAGQGVEAIMRARETLALTEDQISRLDAIRREIVAERSREQAEMAELRSQLAAGQIRQSQVMAAQEERQAAAEGRLEERRARIDAVLTEEQRASVELLRTRADRVRGNRPGPGAGPRIGRGGVGAGGFGPGAAGPGRRGVGRGGLGLR